MFNQFFKPAIKVIKKLDKLGDITKSLGELQKQDVLIGLPQAQNSRQGEPITNAELAYIQSKGSPVNNIPPRPFLEPSIEAHKEKIAKIQAQAFKAALEGKQAEVTITIGKVGMLGQKCAKDWFTDPANHWPANSPITIARKGSDKPLIDTGALRNAIVYVVRKK